MALLVSVPSNPAGRSGSFGAVDELVATAVSNTDGPACAVVGPVELDAPLLVSQGFGGGGRDEDDAIAVGYGRERLNRGQRFVRCRFLGWPI